MTLKRLSIQHLRNLSSVDILPVSRVNLFYGHNGSGKTSVLEAISVLGLGRSFRSHKHKSLINHHQPAFTVFGKIEDTDGEIALGVNRQSSGDAVFKAGGNTVASAAMLAHYLPLQIINADTFQLLEGSPGDRRQFIDWLVFHVEPGFFPAWKDAQRCLKQRNSLLRHDRIDRFEVAIWDQELIRLTNEIDGFRKACLETFNTAFAPLLKEFLAIEGLELHYQRGWDKTSSYEEVLERGFEQDKKTGFTRYGVHRADLAMQLNGQRAADILSRGQQKLLVCALKIAQGYVFNQLTGRRCIYLVDDLPAELDQRYRQLLAKWLDNMETQVFVTGVECETLRDTWQHLPEDEVKVFHVEHGKVSAATESTVAATNMKSGE